MKKYLLIAALVVALAVVAVGYVASSIGMFADEPYFTTDQGAIDGYDPVAFFTMGRAVRGDPEISTSWQGAVWRFVSEAHRDLFAEAPDRYAPAYGGYCSYAMANGYTAHTNPTAWAIVDDRLFLNYDPSVLADWQADQSGMIERADANWPTTTPGRRSAAGP